jgi:hypothetical protein
MQDYVAQNPEYEVWYKGYVVVRAKNGEEAVKRADELVRRGRRLLPPSYPEPLDVIAVE